VKMTIRPEKVVTAQNARAFLLVLLIFGQASRFRICADQLVRIIRRCRVISRAARRLLNEREAQACLFSRAPCPYISLTRWSKRYGKRSKVRVLQRELS
jgi:hypothetical protein